MELADVPQRYQDLYRRAMKGQSRKAAIRAHCLMCCGWQYVEAANCTAPTCPLYPQAPRGANRVGGVGAGGAEVLGEEGEGRVVRLSGLTFSKRLQLASCGPSARQMQGSGHRLAAPNSLVVDLRSPLGRRANGLDSSRSQAREAFIADPHHSVRPLPYHQNLGCGFQHRGEIGRFEGMSLVTPPIVPHPRRQDDDVRSVGLTVYLDSAEFVRIDPGLPGHRQPPDRAPPERPDALYYLPGVGESITAGFPAAVLANKGMPATWGGSPLSR